MIFLVLVFFNTKRKERQAPSPPRSLSFFLFFFLFLFLFKRGVGMMHAQVIDNHGIGVAPGIEVIGHGETAQCGTKPRKPSMQPSFGHVRFGGKQYFQLVVGVVVMDQLFLEGFLALFQEQDALLHRTTMGYR